jgi:CheY-like chemotaxis protein
MRVLTVDDDNMNRKVCRAMLEMAGVEVVEASSGTEALTYIEEEMCFDAVLMDMRMPGMDGYRQRRLSGHGRITSRRSRSSSSRGAPGVTLG